MDNSEIGPAGRVARFLLGGYLFLVAVPYYFAEGKSLTFLGSTYSSDYISALLAFFGSLALLMFYLVIHRASTTYLRNLNRWLGAAIANAPPLVLFVVSAIAGIGFVQIAVLTYVGVAILMAAWRRDPGCEVLSPANAILGRYSHFACIVFSPIDWVERKNRTSRGSNAFSMGPPIGF